MRTLITPLPPRYTAALSLFALVALLLAPTSHAQERGNDLPRVSPNAAVSQTIGVTDVRITYGRPGVKGREIFGGLVPYDEVWRTGANEATTISFSNDVQIEGQPLAAGTYGLFTIPGRSEWTLVFNETADQWGAYEYDDRQDALRVTVAPTEAPHQHEWMSFHIGTLTDTSAVAALVWDRTRVPFTIQTDTDANVRTKAEATVPEAEDWRTPHQYAAYALEHEVYPEAALNWANRSLALEENFHNTALKARLLAAMNRYDEARPLAERALKMAEEMDEAPQGLEQFEKQVANWPSR